MPITIIADTGVNNLFFNTNTGRNIVLSGLGDIPQSVIATGNFNNSLSSHNSLGNIQGGSSDNYYHLTSGEYANLVTGSVIRPRDTGIFYTIDNPSGYITGLDTSIYPTTSFVTGISGYLQDQIDGLVITGDYYPNNNPSGYITGVDLNSYATITGIQRSWNNLVMSWTQEPVLNTVVSSGEVYNYVYGGSTYYRFVHDVYNSIYDSFYESFSDPNLSNLICRRGISI